MAELQRKAAGRKGHYYTPTAQIKAAHDVAVRQVDERRDQYVGSAEALQKAGVITADMLPAPGRCEISWRPTDARPEFGGSWSWVPGYATVKRDPMGTIRVMLVVSHAEQARRRAAEEARRSQHNSERGRSVPRDVGPQTAMVFQNTLRHGLRMIWELASNGSNGYALAPSDRDAILGLFEEADERLLSARVLDPRQQVARGALTLVWTTPA